MLGAKAHDRGPAAPRWVEPNRVRGAFGRWIGRPGPMNGWILYGFMDVDSRYRLRDDGKHIYIYDFYIYIVTYINNYIYTHTYIYIHIYIDLDIMMMENCQLRVITDDECKDNNCWDNWTPERMVIFGSLYSSLPFNNDFVHPTVVPPFGVRLVRVWLEEFLGGFGNQSEDPDWSALCHCYFQETSQIMHLP